MDGCSINPTRSFRPALLAGQWASFWVFLVGPFVGAVVGVGAWLVTSLKWAKGDALGGAVQLDGPAKIVQDMEAPKARWPPALSMAAP